MTGMAVAARYIVNPKQYIGFSTNYMDAPMCFAGRNGMPFRQAYVAFPTVCLPFRSACRVCPSSYV